MPILYVQRLTTSASIAPGTECHWQDSLDVRHPRVAQGERQRWLSEDFDYRAPLDYKAIIDVFEKPVIRARFPQRHQISLAVTPHRNLDLRWSAGSREYDR